MIDTMVSQHRDKPLNVRPPSEDREAVAAALEEMGKEMTAFVTACLRAFRANPDKTMRFLRPHWPEPKPYGRPPKNDQT